MKALHNSENNISIKTVSFLLVW